MKQSLVKPYTHLVQKPYCCGVTCLQMIIQRRLGELFDQEKLAEHFQIKIAPEVSGSFNIQLPLLSSHGHDEGMQTIESEQEINDFFHDNHLPLHAKTYPLSQIKNLKTFIVAHLTADNDLRTEYKLHSIFDSNSIHDWLIESLDIDTDVVTMLNPSPTRQPRYTLTLEQLEEALSPKFARETGIVVISGSA